MGVRTTGMMAPAQRCPCGTERAGTGQPGLDRLSIGPALSPLCGRLGDGLSGDKEVDTQQRQVPGVSSQDGHGGRLVFCLWTGQCLSQPLPLPGLW